MFTSQSCNQEALQPNVKFKSDTTISAIGQMRTCAGDTLTVTEGNVRVTQTQFTPTNADDSLVATFKVFAIGLKMVDQKLKPYFCNENLVFKIKKGPNSQFISFKAKFKLVSIDGTVRKINFKIHQDPNSNTMIVDKGTYDESNNDCLGIL